MSRSFVVTRSVRFVETDMAGVLHFSNYFRLMEEAEHAFWRSLGLSVMEMDGERTISWPRVAASFEYFAPAHFEDELEIVLTLEKLGERSLSYRVEFRCDGRRLAVGKTTAVCCAQGEGSFEPAAIPDSIRTKLEAVLAAPAAED